MTHFHTITAVQRNNHQRHLDMVRGWREVQTRTQQQHNAFVREMKKLKRVRTRHFI